VNLWQAILVPPTLFELLTTEVPGSRPKELWGHSNFSLARNVQVLKRFRINLAHGLVFASRGAPATLVAGEACFGVEIGAELRLQYCRKGAPVLSHRACIAFDDFKSNLGQLDVVSPTSPTVLSERCQPRQLGCLQSGAGSPRPRHMPFPLPFVPAFERDLRCDG
jgi:hypothetical protein